MNSKRLCLVLISVVLLVTANPSFADVNSTGWFAVTHSGEEFGLCAKDSLDTEALYISNGGRFRSLSLDSIDLLVNRSSPCPSARTYIITLAATALGVGIFLNNVPEQPDLTMSSGLIYGLEFGGAMLLGAALGYGVGCIIDRSVADTQRIDLTAATRLEKSAAIRKIISRAAP
jgi:hypothetical protein